MTKREILKLLLYMVHERINRLEKGYVGEAPSTVQGELRRLSVCEDWLGQEVNNLNIQEYPNEFS